MDIIAPFSCPVVYGVKVVSTNALQQVHQQFTDYFQGGRWDSVRSCQQCHYTIYYIINIVLTATLTFIYRHIFTISIV